MSSIQLDSIKEDKNVFWVLTFKTSYSAPEQDSIRILLATFSSLSTKLKHVEKCIVNNLTL